MSRNAAVILRHLPFFLAVAEERTLQAAAVRMNMAQSALSRRIRLLEGELGGVALFQRTARGMRLLPTGEALLAETRALLASVERATAQIGALAAGKTGLVRVGFVELATRRQEMMDAFTAFTHETPGISLDLRPMISEEQRAELVAGGLDAGLLYHDPDEDIVAEIGAEGGPAMQAEPILLDPFLLVAPAGNPLARRKEGVTLAEIGTESVIWASHKKSPRLYDRMLAACEARGFHPRIVMETPTSDITLKFVANDMGVGFVTESLIGHGGPDVAFVPILDFGVAMQLSFVWRRPTGQDALKAFVDFMLPRIRQGAAPALP
jgi:DNA-binding transcriptional LysR family regulator